MPKKSSSGERKSSTRLFRSVSALSSRKNNKDNSGKDGRERTSSGLSADSDRASDTVVADRSSLEGKIVDGGQDRVKNFETELQEMNSKLGEMTSKLHDAELENDNLKSLLSANYNGSVMSPLEGVDAGAIDSQSSCNGFKGLPGQHPCSRKGT